MFSASFSPKRKTFLKQTVCRLPPSTPALTKPPQRSEGGTLGTRGRCRLPLCWEWDGHSVREGSQALSTDLEGVTRRCGRGCEERTARRETGPGAPYAPPCPPCSYGRSGHDLNLSMSFPSTFGIKSQTAGWAHDLSWAPSPAPASSCSLQYGQLPSLY